MVRECDAELGCVWKIGETREDPWVATGRTVTLQRIGMLSTTATRSFSTVVVVVVFTLKTVLTSIQYPSLSYSSRQRNEFPWSQANPK